MGLKMTSLTPLTFKKFLTRIATIMREDSVLVSNTSDGGNARVCAICTTETEQSEQEDEEEDERADVRVGQWFVVSHDENLSTQGRLTCVEVDVMHKSESWLEMATIQRYD